ncbi:unnamed protein product, partial [Vitis vinifera]
MPFFNKKITINTINLIYCVVVRISTVESHRSIHRVRFTSCFISAKDSLISILRFLRLRFPTPALSQFGFCSTNCEIRLLNWGSDFKQYELPNWSFQAIM